jgi:thioredoxin:protein disulfide reductase
MKKTNALCLLLIVFASVPMFYTPVTAQFSGVPKETQRAQSSVSHGQLTPRAHATQQKTSHQSHSFSQKLSDLVNTTHAVWLKILLVLLLGLLMSLTPCMYPMVPITLGILQSSGSSSIGRNFFLSLLYTCGIATTFATLGLLAAFTGQVFGSIMMNPFFVTALSVLLVYLALSMFGLYDMYTPRFMRTGPNAQNAGRSLISVFLFGAASGTVASPCLSPGLILVLSIVTTLGSKFLGFLMLFAFGFGLGIPLLILGVFSSSLSALPRAGLWMIEVKKLFGFMLFGMVFYFISPLVSTATLLTFVTVSLLIASIAYFYSIKPYDTKAIKISKNIIGILCATCAVITAIKTYQAFTLHHEVADTFWYTNPDDAFTKAKNEGKKLFIDVSADFCSICKAIDKTLLSNDRVRAILAEKFVPLKLMSTTCSQARFDDLCKKYNVLGFPTFLLIDANTGNLVARWGGELYGSTPQHFIDELSAF